ncbi:SAM-dependent methyltransferase [Thermocatellispora tengchongensis]|uniref:SAM-dependent methyltransferase n=2 Tax=Thermocatellispora tengchongensis TaxID=1073253 RepID=UPI0036349F4E
MAFRDTSELHWWEADEQRLTVGRASPPGVDPSVPNIARVYDYWLGGKDNSAADREMGDRVKAVVPQMPLLARQNRWFLGRAVKFLAGKAGIGRFLDIGSGLPTMNNVHEVAQATRADAEVVYVDNDPVVLAHARALLATDRHTHAVHGDVYEPLKIVEAAREIFGGDDRPVAVLMLAVMHFVPDKHAYRIVHRIMDAMPYGSFLVLSHVADTPEIRAASGVYHASAVRAVPRSVAGVRRFFRGLELLEPGVVPLPLLLPDTDFIPDLDDRPEMASALAGVGWKRR